MTFEQWLKENEGVPRSVFRLHWRHLQPGEDREDLWQDILATMATAFDKHDPARSPLGGYMHWVARGAALEHMNKLKRPCRTKRDQEQLAGHHDGLVSTRWDEGTVNLRLDLEKAIMAVPEPHRSILRDAIQAKTDNGLLRDVAAEHQVTWRHVTHVLERWMPVIRKRLAAYRVA